MTHVHINFCDLLQLQTVKLFNSFWHCSLRTQSSTALKCYKESLKHTFDTYRETVLHTLKFQLLVHVIECLKCLGCWELLSSPGYERFNALIIQAYLLTSLRRQSALKEILSAVDMNNGYRTPELSKARMTMKSAVSETLLVSLLRVQFWSVTARD